jgi:hypothetical protein
MGEPPAVNHPLQYQLIPSPGFGPWHTPHGSRIS